MATKGSSKWVVVGVRLPRHLHSLLLAVQMVRGDETLSDTLREAVRLFVRMHMKRTKEGGAADQATPPMAPTGD